MAKSNAMLSHTVYQHILDLIMSQKLFPGDKIPETKVAQEFHISRTPVRDAIQQLANEGLLEIFPNRFVQVKQYSPEDITHIGTLRLAMDTISVKLASLYGSRADFLKLSALAQQCEEAYQQNNLAMRRELDCKFHMALAEITGNELLIKFQKELYLRIQYIMLCYPKTAESDLAHIRQHYAIADALMQNDAPLAQNLIADHLISFYKLNEIYPDDFFQ